MHNTSITSQKTWHNTSKQWYSIIGLLIIYLIAYTVGLNHNRYGNEFYAAAAQAGAHSWKAFFYGASDFNSTITVDKPPLSLWPSSLAVRIFGLNSWSLLWPQVIIGLVTSWIIYLTVRRYTSHLTAWLAVFSFITCPLVFVMFRFNNPDAMLLLLVTLSMYTAVRSIGSVHGEASRLTSWQWSLLTGFIMGLSFLTKQLEGLMTIPALALGILVCIPGWRHKISSLFYNFIGLLIGAGWWTTIVELIPQAQRPFIGGSPTNDFIQLTLYYNGISRLTGTSFSRFSQLNYAHDIPKVPSFSHSTAGFSRFLYSFEATQIGLLTSLAVVGIILSYFWLYRWQNGTQILKSLYIINTVWLISLWLIFSFMGAVFHSYYPLIIATPLAILSSSALVILWQNRNQWWAKKIALLIIIVESCTAVISSVNGEDLTPNYVPWAIGIIGIISLVIAIMMMRKTSYAYALKASHPWTVWTSIGILAITFLPSLYYLGTSYSHNTVTVFPVAGPGLKETYSFSHQDKASCAILLQRIDRYISQDGEKYTWIAGSIGLDTPDYQLKTGYSVMPVGGFAGFDPAPTLNQLKKIIRGHHMHYFILSTDNDSKIQQYKLGSTASKKDKNYSDKKTMAEISQPEIYSYITTNFPFKEFSGKDDIFKIYDLTQPLQSAKK